MLVIDVVNRCDHLGISVCCLPPLEACIVPFCTMNASSQGGNIQVTSSSEISVSEVQDVFINNDRHSTSER